MLRGEKEIIRRINKVISSDEYFSQDKISDLYFELDQLYIDDFENKLKVIKKLKGKAFIKDIKYMLEDCTLLGHEITNESKGEAGFITDDLKVIKQVWGKEWAIGMDGDSYNGYFSVKIKDKQYLTLHYSI